MSQKTLTLNEIAIVISWDFDSSIESDRAYINYHKNGKVVQNWDELIKEDQVLIEGLTDTFCEFNNLIKWSH